jgi:hypothetical protein
MLDQGVVRSVSIIITTTITTTIIITITVTIIMAVIQVEELTMVAASDTGTGDDPGSSNG